MLALARQRVLIAALPLLGFALWTIENLSGQPNIRWGAVLLAWAVVASGVTWWLTSGHSDRVLAVVDRNSGKIAVGVIVAYALVLCALSTVQAWFFAPGMFAYDTAYYGQILWNTLHGNFLSGNLQQEHLYHPPVSSDLAIHVSPVLAVLLPIYALLPNTLTLLLLRDLALAAAAWPLFLIARERMGGCAGIAAILLYCASPVVNAQAVGAFSLLHFAPLPVLFAVRAMLNKTFGSFVAWSCVALSLREDLAVTLGAFGLLVLLRRYPLRWSVMGLLVPIAWWGLATLVIEPAFGRMGNARFDDVLTGGSDSRFAIYEVLFGNPSWLLDALSHGGREYFLRLIGWAGYAGILGPEALLAAPGVAMQVFVGQVSYVGLDPYSRLTLVSACALLAATVVTVARISRHMGVDKRALAITVFLLLPSVTLLDGNKDLVQKTLALSVLNNDRTALRQALREIPADAAVAAPNYLLPYLANRTKLYFGEQLSDYENHPSPEYMLLDRNVDRLWLNYEKIPPYRAQMTKWLSSGEYSTIWQRGDYLLLRRNAG